MVFLIVAAENYNSIWNKETLLSLYFCWCFISVKLLFATDQLQCKINNCYLKPWNWPLAIMWNENYWVLWHSLDVLHWCAMEQCLDVWTWSFTTSLLISKACKKINCVTSEMADEPCLSFQQEGASDIPGHLPVTCRRCSPHTRGSEGGGRNARGRALEIPRAEPATVPHQPQGEHSLPALCGRRNSHNR